jgi:hypothetical protein
VNVTDGFSPGIWMSPALGQAGQPGGISGRQARNRTSFLKFWTVAASRNSSLAPVIPRSRSRLKPKFRFRWANAISTLRRSRAERAKASVPFSGRTYSRSASKRLRVTIRFSPLVQRGFKTQARQSSSPSQTHRTRRPIWRHARVVIAIPSQHLRLT